jgi:hypothetical protein
MRHGLDIRASTLPNSFSVADEQGQRGCMNTSILETSAFMGMWLAAGHVGGAEIVVGADVA